MEETELLLSNEFANFSKIINSVREEKQLLEEEFKVQFTAYKSKRTELEKKVADAQAEWESWKEEQKGKESKDVAK